MASMQQKLHSLQSTNGPPWRHVNPTHTPKGQALPGTSVGVSSVNTTPRATSHPGNSTARHFLNSRPRTPVPTIGNPKATLAPYKNTPRLIGHGNNTYSNHMCKQMNTNNDAMVCDRIGTTASLQRVVNKQSTDMSSCHLSSKQDASPDDDKADVLLEKKKALQVAKAARLEQYMDHSLSDLSALNSPIPCTVRRGFKAPSRSGTTPVAGDSNGKGTGGRGRTRGRRRSSLAGKCVLQVEKANCESKEGSGKDNEEDCVNKDREIEVYQCKAVTEDKHSQKACEAITVSLIAGHDAEDTEIDKNTQDCATANTDVSENTDSVDTQDSQVLTRKRRRKCSQDSASGSKRRSLRLAKK